jgi:hypothetical protein
MKKIIALSAALGLSTLGLAGCNSSTTATVIAEVQQATVLACAVEPTAASVAALIAGANAGASAGVALASQIASQICKAVAASPAPAVSKVGAPLVPAPVVVHGVTVQFEPVKK